MGFAVGAPGGFGFADGLNLCLHHAVLGPDDVHVGAVAAHRVIGMHAVGEQVARAGAFAAVLLGLPGTDGRARDLADDGGQDDIAFQFHAAFMERLAGHHEGGDAAFHVRDPQALNFVADDFAGEFGLRLP